MPVPSIVRNARFAMHDYNGELRIVRIDPLTPFVSRAAALEWLKSKLGEQKDAAGRALIEAAIRQLEAPSKSAPTPASK